MTEKLWIEGRTLDLKEDSRIPDGPIEEKWTRYKNTVPLVSPANKRRFTIIVVGSGLAGASASASLAQLGYNVLLFTYHDSPRRAHSIAAQGGINAAKNYQNDGDSVWRLFYDTMKGGDFRAREANVYRLAEISPQIIDYSVAIGVPFAREYGGLLANRSFGGVLVQRTFYARGQTGQQLLLGAISQVLRWWNEGRIKIFPRHEILDVVLIDGHAKGIIARDLITGELKRYAGHAVVLATGGYGNAYFLSTNAVNSNATAIWRAYKRGAYFGNPCFVQVHPTALPETHEYQSKRTLMSESLRNDGRVWVPRKKGDTRHPNEIPHEERWYFLEEWYPAYGNLVPRDVASRAIKKVCDMGYGLPPTGRAVYLDLLDAIKEQGRERIEAKYGNLFEMYEKITGESPWEVPMKIYPAVHYTMGGLWVSYELQTSIPGLYAIGEANFSDHGANRLGASALMQGLADGYYILPYTIGAYLANRLGEKLPDTESEEFKKTEQEVKERIEKLLSINGNTPPDEFHMKLGHILWDKVGLSRSKESLLQALQEIRELKQEFWKDVKVVGDANTINQELEKAGRIADFIELGELITIDALHREESCGAHFREEYQTEEGEPLRRDDEFAYVAAWEYNGEGNPPILNKEPLKFEAIKPTVRSYK
ncbi:MAG: fumarate reductase/succinate dehydrogenase flavoprotein subunit [Chlorobi bacterium]|nr:fumarate reductase/succinate dehydrogenase flavoprotein subunit [Chlorobiota bacterium]